MTKDVILKRLQAGESADDILGEITEAVNAALAEKKAIDDAKRQAEEEKAWQLKDAEGVAERLNDYLLRYCRGTGHDITAEAIVESSDLLEKLLSITDNVKTTVKQTVKTPDGKVKTTIKTGEEAEDWAGDIFKEFFKAFGL